MLSRLSAGSSNLHLPLHPPKLVPPGEPSSHRHNRRPGISSPKSPSLHPSSSSRGKGLKANSGSRRRLFNSPTGQSQHPHHRGCHPMLKRSSSC